MDRRLFIVAAVVGFHVLGLWALQTGLLRRAVELVVPVAVMAELIEPPQPQVTPEPTPPKPQPAPKPVTPVQRVVKQAPMPLAISDPTPAPEAPTGVVSAPPAPQPAVTEPVAAAPVAPPAPPKVELPSSDANYLNNPQPPYPPLSKRLREQGRVMVRVHISADGIATRAEVQKSSGFLRLDETAVQTVLRWRYVPGKRAGVPEAMWYLVPIDFRLED
ncbi:energy transducer TonB [Hydrogenophaga pseudoflava]|uniref:energy transducer TonB n=1 Tax=Hydrogenophaga pseudoflava TaxID=47421 RepID=UPI0027E46655|nr:TonB family protein [Hydrogenophaga pseudoflava]MDQ7744051.1 TonB family protein [Hydrogenophaga pseudoflava]